MSNETTGSEILDQYRSTSNKLKKRFLRKPNLSEASESYSGLAKQCENDELPAYAGLFYFAASKCELSLGDTSASMSNLTKASRQFLLAETKLKQIGCVSPYNENLHASLTCFTTATDKNPDKVLNICANLEITEHLSKLDLEELKEEYLKEAVELSEDSLDTKIGVLLRLAEHSIATRNFTKALECYTKITSIIEQMPTNGARMDILLDCEISSVFLLLILRPPPQKLTQNLGRLLEKYTWGDDKSFNAQGMSEDLFILMQSLVLTCQSLDRSSLCDLETEMWKYLTIKQRNLLRILVRMYER